MRMVKSLLLGSTASVVMVTMGQATASVKYVKVCGFYGAGFYQMPGTDLCIKMAGWVRAEATYGSNQTGSLGWGPFNANLQDRTTNNFQVRARGYIIADVRGQTAYGTARGYLEVGTSNSDVGLAGGGENVFRSNRAFVQWAGITAGLARSFYDFYSARAVLYRANYIPAEGTGDSGWWVWAYTAQLGNGVSASFSAETRRMSQIIDQTGVGTVTAAGVVTNATPLGTVVGPANAGGGYGGQQVPDIVGNIRIDQTWGAAQIMAAAHMVNPNYYAATGGSSTVQPAFGHPGDSWGWVVGAGLKLNFPMIAQGDYFQGEVNYTQGALRYLNQGIDGNYNMISRNQQAYGVLTDCVYGGVGAGLPLGPTLTTGCQLTSAWSVNASYEHYWTPQWHQSLAGGFFAVKYNTLANAMLCSGAGGGNGAGVGSTAVATLGCSNNWNYWGIGSRLQWDVTKTFYLGVEVLYSRLDSAKTFNGLVNGTGYAINTTVVPLLQTGRLDNWTGSVRMHKDFLP